MMYDEKILISCTNRISNIYKRYKNKNNDFTLLLVSFAGLLSVLDENVRKEIFKNFSFPDWFVPKENDGGNNGETMGEYTIRHLRNSFCHFKLDPTNIVTNNENQIIAVKFIDKKSDKLKTVFEYEMTLEQIEELFYQIVDAIKNCDR